MTIDAVQRPPVADAPHVEKGEPAMRVAFLFFAEAYQVYHGAAVAFALMQRRGVQVDVFHNMPDSAHHFARLAKIHGVENVVSQPLQRNRWTRFVQSLRVFGWEKTPILRQNEAMLRGYDAVITTEDGAATLFAALPADQRPKRILIVHGAGDRAVPSISKCQSFDLLLTAGMKDADKFLEMGLARPGHIAVPGYVKFDSSRLLRAQTRALFPNARPIILYNPHKHPKLGSWKRFVKPLLREFSAQSDYNLIIAPHVKMFLRSSDRRRQKWRARSQDHILIDTGSDRSVDNSYTEAADIYVGDVSSQVYEFLERPRPCVFLNSSGADWRGDKNFLFWQLGDVVDDPKDMMDAIRNAPARHHLYRDKQREFAAQSLGNHSAGAADRAADAIVEFMNHGKVAL